MSIRGVRLTKAFALGVIAPPSFDMPDVTIEDVWARIEHCQGEIFRQIRGAEFRYEVHSGAVHPDRTNRAIPRSNFEVALARCPLPNTTVLQRLQGPSYVYAVLMDPRIRRSDW